MVRAAAKTTPKNDKIEPAKTNRSSCTECKAQIAKDEVRLGILKKSSHGEQDQWYHAKCYLKFKKNFEKDVEEMIGYDNLTKAQQAAIKKQFAQAKKDSKEDVKTTTATKGAAKATAATTTTPVVTKTATRQANKVEDKKVEKKTGGKYGGYSPAELKSFKEHKEEIEDNSVAELKALLKKNGVTQSGNRDELINRVADCKTLGTYPNCLKCGGGRLKFRQDNGTYFCKGYMDDADFVNCSATYSKNEVSRGTWVD